ncbi:MAG: hypothetical protein IJG45_06550 [Oscillospiraceae bacterium]|nr:hypothetical protein [Oscillospiraceae bacterium]
MLLKLILAAFAACGLLMVLRALLEAVLLPFPGNDAVHVYYLRGGSAEAEHAIRACLHLRERRGMRGMLIFADGGLTPEAQETAELLLRREPDTALCSKAQVFDYIRQENDEVGAGTD